MFDIFVVNNSNFIEERGCQVTPILSILVLYSSGLHMFFLPYENLDVLQSNRLIPRSRQPLPPVVSHKVLLTLLTLAVILSS
ncbi:hypothetical protein [Nostoc sp.]|uniref:hypothetical protein n=1 Tax=Nostoc sp. TaxID=1180 RepID=UPI003FA53DB0